MDAVMVSAPNWIGDAVMATPTLTALRAALPAARITVLARPAVASLLEGHPHVDDFVVRAQPGHHDGLVGRLRLAADLRRRRFDTAVLLPNALDAALLAWGARIPRRIGYASDGRRLLLTDTPMRPHGAHQIEEFVHLLSPLGIASAETASPHLHLRETERAAVARTLPERFVALHPGAAYGGAKRWPPECFAAVADALAARWNAAVVVVGSSAEASIGRAVRTATRVPHVIDRVHDSVRDLMAIVSLAQVLVANDSGPMHIAAALGTPVVGVFGPTRPQRTAPRSPRSRVVGGGFDCRGCPPRECARDQACMRGVTVEAVVAAAEALRNG